MKLRLTLDVDYVLEGESKETMKRNLEFMVNHSVDYGLLSGDTKAWVDTWSMKIEEVDTDGTSQKDS